MARVLIADDEVDLAEVLAEILRDEGHEVRTASDGADALRTIRGWRPEIVILDVDMPGLSGPAVAFELSRERTGLEAIPVVLLSGNADVERVGAAAGIPYCIVKPVPPGELLHVLDAALARGPSGGGPGARRHAT